MPELEEMSTQVYSLEEQVYKAMALMVNQPTQNAVIKMPDKKTKFVRTPTIEPGFARDERVARFKEDCYKLANFVKTEQEAKAHLDKRILELTKTTSKAFLFSEVEQAGFRDSTKPRLKG